ncbi:MAG TPA: prolyl oligopeptidase family serine peptidase [Melioribacteraceae bacterium]|nr:prolyl oligopeptidase family serine peptidase [Melioribacteraceae bacterium]
MKRSVLANLPIIFLILSFTVITAQNKRAMTLEDVMKFKQIKELKISEKGNFISYASKPDRGNWDFIVSSTGFDKEIIIPNGSRGEFSNDENYIYAFIEPDFFEYEKAEKEKPRAGLELLNIKEGKTEKWKDIKSASFSRDSRWLAFHHFEKKDTSKNVKPKKNIGTTLVLKELTGAKEDTINLVTSFAFDSLSSYLAFSVLDTSRRNNGLYLWDLKKREMIIADTAKNSVIENLTWHRSNKLAYLKTILRKDQKKDSCELKMWDNGKVESLAGLNNLREGYYIPVENRLTWSKDGERLFFGIKQSMINNQNTVKDTSKNSQYDFDKILAKKEADVWHWNDPLIKSNEKIEWKQREKSSYQTIYDYNAKAIVYLIDDDYSRLIKNENPDKALILTDKEYLKERTWVGNIYDLYSLDLKSGERKLIENNFRGSHSLSPHGKYTTVYKEKQWYLKNLKTLSSVCLTDKLTVPFYDEDNDTPDEPSAYGIAGWLEDDKFVLIYDKYDIWKFNTSTGASECITDGFGRSNNYSFRIFDLDKEKVWYESDEEFVLTAFHEKEKFTSLYKLGADRKGVTKILEEQKKFTVIGKAAGSDKLFYSRQSYNEYPDIWVTDLNFRSPEKLTDLNSQLEQFAWGTSQVIEWNSLDGKPIQGAVILPGNFQADKRYPVLVYYYEISSQRVHDFNEMVVNHRPNFPFYASNDYIVFLPDVKFDIERPGYSATKCILPGCQKLIALGWADPKGFGLHGHSWSGYQSAHVITQTDFFACAIAGAPVGNMTSAYSGIRWGTGLARQFQYEKSQSRIGGTLWEKTMSYIENSPVFFADKVNTPLLLMHGDEDDAVPWYQSIEIYLAMRRLGKDCIFLQYRGEKHHPVKYPNKLDYSIKMKEYLDHYCKGLPAADWITKGEPYKGK